MTNYIEEYMPMVKQLSAEYSRRYQMVELNDVAQELWLWFVTHTRKYKEWTELGMKDRDKLVARSLRNAALKYCQREKAKAAGYDISDLYYYDSAVIEVYLPSIVAESYEMPVKIKDLGAQTSKGNITDGVNWLVLRSDIASAFYKLSETKQNILRLRFSNELAEWSDLAKDLDTTADGARMKVKRAIASLIDHLGGWRPQHDEEAEETTTDADTETTDTVPEIADDTED